MKIYTAAELRTLRKSLGLNQDEFWLHFGVLQSGGSRYESGREVSEASVKSLAYAESTLW